MGTVLFGIVPIFVPNHYETGRQTRGQSILLKARNAIKTNLSAIAFRFFEDDLKKRLLVRVANTQMGRE